MSTAAQMLLATLNARDRVDALHSFFDRPRTGTWWAVTATILLVAAATVFLAAILVHRFHEAKRRKEFRQRAGDAGINPEEQKLLNHLANLAGLKQAGAVLDAPEAFERGADALLRSERVSALDEDLQARTRAEPFRAVLAGEEAVAEQIVLEPAVAMRCESNESWTLRYAEGGLLWEFDARVVRQEETGRVVMLPGGKVRCVNRRKFIRTPVDIPAFVAPFPFLRDAEDDGLPRFLPATLVEIAGPGLRIQAPLEIGMGERMLVGLRIDGRVMQALGITRRPAVLNDQGIPEVVVELVGLTAPEVSELVRVTNAAVRASRSRGGSEPAEPGRPLQQAAAREG